MTRGVRWYLVGSLVLVTLAGCKQSWLEEREPWRGEAEMTCLKSGAVKESPSVVLLGPINGPGMCGADFPLKVGTLGEGDGALSYSDDPVRPPGVVPQGGSPYPRQPVAAPAPSYQVSPYPANQPYPANPQYPTNTPFAVNPAYPADTRLPPNPTYRPDAPYEPAAPASGATQYPPRLEPLAPASGATQYPQRPEPYAPPARYRRVPTDNGPALGPASGPASGPVSLTPPGIEAPGADAAGTYQTPLPQYGAPRTIPSRDSVSPRGYPSPASAAEAPRRPDPIERTAPFSPRYPGGGEVVPLSPSRERAALATTASVSPAATLACPIVSVLDRWITEAVQPAAQKWFGQPVVEIKQISAYSCRGMNGNPNAHISEHAFGNALDIAAFVLADGRKITVEKGWHGIPEEQAFLHDVQAAACEVFTTVLAPGSNVYHYNHIHVDLMRHNNGRHICEPRAVAGDEVAARVRSRYAASRGDSSITGSIPSRRSSQATTRNAPYTSYDEEDDRHLPDAVAGED